MATGSVQFKDNGTNLGTPQSLNAVGESSVVSGDLTVGAHTITATYTPDSPNYNPSSGDTSQIDLEELMHVFKGGSARIKR